ncbi:hypothetical protein H257_03842 [Aphanomyces astaci]|uniref:Uncharacterized protein n=1 Tax=Aphanomyces astaci TaxID=112090 RepID=W4GYJ5_APHAT|nr:hypothetical protein H257_03842 [Aphanomyces astaci]ETV84737.1 hypothetical protein H257_03842 [Aphanomyces astaci]|eukprot:XP_009826429.1 hypothetical protein H257_03842 [Aphanomyces astaci]
MQQLEIRRSCRSFVDLLVEINGRDTSMMSVKKTVAFVKTCTKTALLKFKRSLCISMPRASA